MTETRTLVYEGGSGDGILSVQVTEDPIEAIAVTPPEIAAEATLALSKIRFDSDGHRAAAELKELWRKKERTKAALLYHLDSVVAQGRWIVFDYDGVLLWESVDLWLEYALGNLEIYGSARTTMLAWSTVLAPFLRANEVVDPLTGMRITPDYCLAEAGWTKIGDIAGAWYSMVKLIESGLAEEDLRNEATLRLATTVKWIVDPGLRRRKNNLNDPTETLDCRLKAKGWRIPRGGARPATLGGKPYARVQAQDESFTLVIANLTEEDVNWLVLRGLDTVLSIDEWPLNQLGLQQVAKEED